ncbi:MMPL family transporter [Nocardia nepalensis]|uniref:MMPL family transporter n=1 Tax=Nocardia nepalensis TaxID=3375448 RepID=UPI003B679CE7
MGARTRASLVIVVWIAALAALLPLAGRLNGVKSNEATEYLPASAQSTTVAEIDATLPGGTTNLFTVAYSRPGGLTPTDRAAAERQFASLNRRFGSDTDAMPPGETSPDGTVLLYSLAVGQSHGKPTEYIDDLRAMVSEHPDGLTVQVTGPAAAQADFEGAFEGVDSRLLLFTVVVVTILLLLIYRSPVLWLLPLLSVALGDAISMAVVYGQVQLFDVAVNDQTSGLLTVLAFGVGTDYALLIVARYREELHRHSIPATAMAAALRAAAPAIIASAATVSVALLCLLAADMRSTSGMGPVGAATILCTLAVMLTFFPALLVLCGRWVFWPRIPHPNAEALVPRAGVWDRLGAAIARRPGAASSAAIVVLLLLTLGWFGNTSALSQADRFIETPESVAGQTLIAEHFPERAGQPLIIMARNEFHTDVLRAVRSDPGVGVAEDGRTGPTFSEIVVIPVDQPDSKGEIATIERLRATLPKVGAGTVVGGASAANLDVADASAHDNWVVLPLVLLVVTVILGLLLRSVAAPIGLVLTVVLSFGSALGASIFAFQHVFGFHGLEPSLVVLTFLFLVALGVDYNIFLMSRAREEAQRTGTRTGMLRSLAVTGGVITSAGIVLAATFAVLITLPLVATAQIGFAVAFGVLLDALLVRSVLVPALTLLAGSTVWWPSDDY